MAFCDCEFLKRLYNIKDYKTLIKCHCGEEDYHEFLWKWDIEASKEFIESDDGFDVVFHPNYSVGTAIVRSDRPLARNAIHYWEIRVLSELCGTDVVGITCWEQNLCLCSYNFRCLALEQIK